MDAGSFRKIFDVGALAAGARPVPWLHAVIQSSCALIAAAYLVVAVYLSRSHAAKGADRGIL